MAELNLKNYIKRAFIANCLMILYFFSPNILSFAVMLLGISIFDCCNSLSCLKQFCSPESSQKCQISGCINKAFSAFRTFSIIEQLILIVLLKLAVDFTWLFPSWFIIFFSVQLYSSWSLLKDVGVIELVEGHIKTASSSIQKLKNSIPKFQE